MNWWSSFGVSIDVSDWNWKRFDSRIVLRPTAQTWMRHLIYVLITPVMFLVTGYFAFGLPWNPGGQRDRLQIKEPDEETIQQLQQNLSSMREDLREQLGPERFAEFERTSAERARLRQQEQQRLATRHFWVGVGISLAGWLLFSPLLLLGFVVVMRLLRLPIAVATIERNSNGSLVLTAPALVGTRVFRVDGAQFIQCDCQVRRVRKYGLKYSVWRIRLVCPHSHQRRYPTLEIDECMGDVSQAPVPGRVCEFARDLSRAIQIPTLHAG